MTAVGEINLSNAEIDAIGGSETGTKDGTGVETGGSPTGYT